MRRQLYVHEPVYIQDLERATRRGRMVRGRHGANEKFYFDPDEAAALKAAYDDALAKLGTRYVPLGSSEALAGQIVHLGRLRAGLGQTISGHSDAQLLSFLALQALK